MERCGFTMVTIWSSSCTVIQIQKLFFEFFLQLRLSFPACLLHLFCFQIEGLILTQCTMCHKLHFFTWILEHCAPSWHRALFLLFSFVCLWCPLKLKDVKFSHIVSETKDTMKIAHGLGFMWFYSFIY